MIPEPTARQSRTISAIWILPIIACCICAWLLYSSYKNAGVEIIIYFQDASGIVPGKTQVMAKGIPIGLVNKVDPDFDNKQIAATVTMNKDVANHLVEDTQFWIVRPQLSASSVQGLETILSGSYIGAQPGTSTALRHEFKGLSSPPPIPANIPGLHLQLRAEVLGSIQVGTGVYYRNVEVGKVQKYQLERDKNILIDIFIEPQFASLVRQGSRFCNASGIQINGKLPNIKIQIESLASLLRGGILLHTPEQLQETPKVVNNHIFPLFADYESANYGIPMTLTLASGEDIIEGATKVMYRGLEAGFVKEIEINNDQHKTVTAHILLDPRAELILREMTKFWLVKPEISPAGIKNMRLLLSGAHITFQPGTGEFKNHFEILPEPPFQQPLRPGKSFVLLSEEPIQVSTKSPIFYKNIKVGEVVEMEISKSGSSIRTTIFIYQKHLNLLSKKSVFWVHSGLEMEATIQRGFTLSTGPVTKLLQGGISFTSPDKLAKKKNFSPEEGFEYPLYNSYDKAVEATPALQQPGKRIQIVATDASSLSIGAPILHKNIQIGEIEAFRLTDDQKNVLIEAFIYYKFRKIVHKKSRFYNSSGVQISGGLDGIQLQTGSLLSVIAGGIACINLPEGEPVSSAKPYPLFASLEKALHADETEITIFIQSIKGLKQGSAIRYKGIDIGKVHSLTFNKNLDTIIAKASIQHKAIGFFRENSKIWVAQAEINLSGVKNVETLVFGSFLTILPGDGPLETRFTALEDSPNTAISNINGLGIILDTPNLGSLSAGSPVYYRQVQIGKVTGFELSPTFQKVHVFISINNRYSSVVRKNTRFWNISGAKIEGGIFSGLTISTGSIETIMRGGIALATPDNEKTGPAASPGDHFTLYEEADKEWLDWNPDVVLLELEESEELLTPINGK